MRTPCPARPVKVQWSSSPRAPRASPASSRPSFDLADRDGGGRAGLREVARVRLQRQPVGAGRGLVSVAGGEDRVPPRRPGPDRHLGVLPAAAVVVTPHHLAVRRQHDEVAVEVARAHVHHEPCAGRSVHEPAVLVRAVGRDLVAGLQDAVLRLADGDDGTPAGRRRLRGLPSGHRQRVAPARRVAHRRRDHAVGAVARQDRVQPRVLSFARVVVRAHRPAVGVAQDQIRVEVRRHQVDDDPLPGLAFQAPHPVGGSGGCAAADHPR